MIAGGKLTTYRVMAKDAVDVAVPDARDLHHRAGAAGRRGRLPRAHQPAGAVSRRAGLSVARSTTCWGATAVWSTRCSRCWPRAPGWPSRSRAPRSTWPPRSCTPSPTRARATSTTSSPGVPASRSRPSTAASTPPARPPRLMAGELGWDEARTADEVDHYLRRVEAERQSQTMLTDQEADEARVSAPDIV